MDDLEQQRKIRHRLAVLTQTRPHIQPVNTPAQPHRHPSSNMRHEPSPANTWGNKPISSDLSDLRSQFEQLSQHLGEGRRSKCAMKQLVCSDSAPP